MSIVVVIFEAVRTITFYIVIAAALILCYSILAYVLGFDYRSKKALIVSFFMLALILILDNLLFSIFHVHVINTKIALGAIPDPIF